MAQIFIYLLVAHLVGDWLIQTHWMATEKSKSLPPLLAHIVTYHIFIFAALCLAGVPLVTNILATLGLAATHAFLDNRRFEIWWLRKIKKFKEKEIPIWLLLGITTTFRSTLLSEIKTS